MSAHPSHPWCPPTAREHAGAVKTSHGEHAIRFAWVSLVRACVRAAARAAAQPHQLPQAHLMVNNTTSATPLTPRRSERLNQAHAEASPDDATPRPAASKRLNTGPSPGQLSNKQHGQKALHLVETARGRATPEEWDMDGAGDADNSWSEPTGKSGRRGCEAPTEEPCSKRFARTVHDWA